jgi:hypothetical protein
LSSHPTFLGKFLTSFIVFQTSLPFIETSRFCLFKVLEVLIRG